MSDAAAPERRDVPTSDARNRVVTRLLYKGVITPEEVDQAEKSREELLHMGLNLVLWRVLALDLPEKRDQIFEEAADLYAFGPADISKRTALTFIREVLDQFSDEQWARMLEFHILPVAREEHPRTQEWQWIFATFDPARTELQDLVRKLGARHFELRYAPEHLINTLVKEAIPRRNEYLDRIDEQKKSVDLGVNFEYGSALIDEQALEEEIGRSTLINLFEATLVEAVRKGASDIHIFPNDHNQIEIHLRVDGELSLWHSEEFAHPEAFLAVIKDKSSNVDRFERDAAQDGFIQRVIDRVRIRFRVSVLPVADAAQEIHAESIVIRVLDDRKVVADLHRLGLSEVALQCFEWAIQQPNGMVVLTGPTGSGKSTTLFAALQQITSPKVNVLTIEDPVEYMLPGIRQIKLSHKLGLEGALRSVLRHDPDVVMVGEMRDRHTAELAIKLANTGHLTFSTLHTNDAPSTINRLYKMGVEPFLIAYAINLVVAQRLIRTLCPDCKVVDAETSPFLLEQLGFTEAEAAAATFYAPGEDPSCELCGGSGYKGRRAINEMLPFTEEIRHIILAAKDMVDERLIREQADQEGLPSLQSAAREVALAGETSLREMIRVVASKLQTKGQAQRWKKAS